MPSVLAPTARIPLDDGKPPGKSLEDFLRSHWGPEWPRMREKYGSLDATTSEAGLLDWEDAKPGVIAQARGYYERDLDFFREAFLGRVEESSDDWVAELGIPEDQKEQARSELKSELSEIDGRIEALCAIYVAELDAAMADVLARDPERYPLVDLRDQGDSPGNVHSILVESGGWYVSYACDYSKYPRLLDVQTERDQLFAERMKGVRDFARRWRLGR